MKQTEVGGCGSRRSPRDSEWRRGGRWPWTPHTPQLPPCWALPMYTVPSRALPGGATGRGPSWGAGEWGMPGERPPTPQHLGLCPWAAPQPQAGLEVRTRGDAHTANTAVRPKRGEEKEGRTPPQGGLQPRRAPFSRQGLGTEGRDMRGSPGMKKQGGGRGRRGNNEATAPIPAPALGLGAAGVGAAGRQRQERAPGRGSRRGAAPIRPSTSPLPSHSPLQMYR